MHGELERTGEGRFMPYFKLLEALITTKNRQEPEPLPSLERSAPAVEEKHINLFSKT
jgi:hypothetical protein